MKSMETYKNNNFKLNFNIGINGFNGLKMLKNKDLMPSKYLDIKIYQNNVLYTKYSINGNKFINNNNSNNYLN